MEQVYSNVVQKLHNESVAKGAAAVTTYNGKLIFVIDAEKRWSVENAQNPDETTLYRLTFSSVGGAVEKGESIIEGLHREVMEEIATNIEIFDSEITYYIDLEEKMSPIVLDDDFRPLLIFEQKFVSPGPASVYLIYVFLTKCISMPSPSSEIPAMFSTSLQDFMKLKETMELSEFYNTYELITQRDLPPTGTISPALTPHVLLNVFEHELEGFLQF